MKKYLIALVVLAGCNGQVTEELKQTRDDPVFTVDLRVVPEHRVSEICQNLGVKYENNGCNIFNKATKECVIYVAGPKHVYDTDKMAIMGHELWHCSQGAFHK